MIAVPLAATPNVTTNPNRSSLSAVRGELSAKNKIAQPSGIERQDAAEQQRRQRGSRGEVDREQVERQRSEPRTAGLIGSPPAFSSRAG
jgi:hypothetical protein